LVALLILMLFSAVFWALYFQIFSSFMLFIDRVVNHHVLGFTLPTAAFGSTIPVVIILFSPFLSWLWLRLAKRGIQISAPIKFALGIFQLSLGFLIITWAVHLNNGAAQIAGVWMLLVFFVQTMGELCLSPIGLSVVTLLAPPRLTGMMMGVWFLTLAAGNALAGWLASFTAIPTSITDPHQIALFYADVYQGFGLWGIAIAGLLLLLTPMLNKLILSNP
jgi:POT family proton-dependent oligopeptide transporter